MKESSNLTAGQDNKTVKKGEIINCISSETLKEDTAGADLNAEKTQQQCTVLNELFKQCKRKNVYDFLCMAVICIEITLNSNRGQGYDYIEICTEELEKLKSNMRCRDYLVKINSIWLKLPKEQQDKIEERLRSFLDFMYSI